MWKFYCDRCKEEIGENDRKYNVFVTQKIVFVGNITKRNMDICEKCYNKVINLLGGESEE